MKPEKLDTFMYALMKKARMHSFLNFLEDWDISEDEYEEIKKFFKEKLDIKL